jgi:hypothetical protein
MVFKSLYVICYAGCKATNESPAQSKVEVICATAITGNADMICSTGRKATDKITCTKRLRHNAGAKICDLSWFPPGYSSAIAQQDDDMQRHEAVRADAHNHLCKAKRSDERKGTKLDGWAPDGAILEYIG